MGPSPVLGGEGRGTSFRAFPGLPDRPWWVTPESIWAPENEVTGWPPNSCKLGAGPGPDTLQH